jgi:hypothetical protein
MLGVGAVQIVATLAGSTAIIADAPCRGVSAVNTCCLSRSEDNSQHPQRFASISGGRISEAALNL